VLALVVGAGCGTVVSQGVSGVTGASARYFEIKGVGGETSLDRYKAVGVAAFDPSPMHGAVPAPMPEKVQVATVRQLTESKMFASVTPGAPPAGGLLVRGKFVDFDPGGSGLRAVGFGVNPFLTAQIELVDTGSNQVVGEAMVTGTVKSIVRTGLDELADGVGKAVKGLVERHRTKPD